MKRARWHDALGYYRSGAWTAARASLEALAMEDGYQRLVQIYLGYVRDMEANPPGPDWDAAFTLYDK